MSDQPLNNEELLKIAAEVMDGTRPESDLKKYGISIGGRKTGDDAKQQLLSELGALGALDEDDEQPAESE